MSMSSAATPQESRTCMSLESGAPFAASKSMFFPSFFTRKAHTDDGIPSSSPSASNRLSGASGKRFLDMNLSVGLSCIGMISICACLSLHDKAIAEMTIRMERMLRFMAGRFLFVSSKLTQNTRLFKPYVTFPNVVYDKKLPKSGLYYKNSI